jgi:predicted secreted protein
MERNAMRRRGPTGRQSLAAALALAAVFAFQPASARILVQRFVWASMADAGRTIVLSPGQQLRVRLPVQSGTGYAWQIAPGSTPLLSWNRTMMRARPERPGGPRMQVLALRAMGSGTGQLHLEYRRPWEGGRGPIAAFSLTVRVLPPRFGGVH